MAAAGIGPITALWLPRDYRRPKALQAVAKRWSLFFGLTSRRYASGEVDWTGPISKCGDLMMRSYLYEAASVPLTRVAK
jgi:transposase